MRISGYEFAEGAHFQAGAHRDNPDEVGQYLKRLQKQNGGSLTAEAVVSDAANPNSPLHQFFEWDDSRAAQEHRLAQARGLIRAVVVVYRPSGGKPQSQTRAFVHVSSDDAPPHYRDVASAMKSPSTREAVLTAAWRELQGWRHRHKELTEFATLFDEVDALAETMPDKVRTG